MRCVILLAALLFAMPQVAQAWSVNLSVSFDSKVCNFTFGTEKNATNRFDKDMDIPLPPAPPNPTFDAYLRSKDPLIKRLMVDYRNYMLWEFVIKTEHPVELSWDKPPVHLHMTVDDKFVDMVKEESLKLDAGNYSIIISGYRNETIPTITPLVETTTTPAQTPAKQPVPGFELLITIVAIALAFAIKFMNVRG